MLINSFIFSTAIFADDLSFDAAPSSANYYQGGYHINIVSPGGINWRLYKDNKDASGYTKIYLPRKADNAFDQSLTVTYDSSNQESVNNSMQDVLDALNKTDCQVSDHKVLEKFKNHIAFVVNLEQCANNKSITQIFKIYHADDGQYSIVYSADLGVIDQDTVTRMKSAILTSQLVEG